MNIDQAKKVRELISGVYDSARAHSKDDTMEALKEKAIRQVLFELIELFPEGSTKLPCDEPVGTDDTESKMVGGFWQVATFPFRKRSNK